MIFELLTFKQFYLIYSYYVIIFFSSLLILANKKILKESCNKNYMTNNCINNITLNSFTNINQRYRNENFVL